MTASALIFWITDSRTYIVEHLYLASIHTLIFHCFQSCSVAMSASNPSFIPKFNEVSEGTSFRNMSPCCQQMFKHISMLNGALEIRINIERSSQHLVTGSSHKYRYRRGTL